MSLILDAFLLCIYMKQPTSRVLLVLAVRLIVQWCKPCDNSPTRPRGHFTGWAKKKWQNNKQQTKGGRKKQTNRDSGLQNAGRWSWHFLAFLYVFMRGYRENSAKILHRYWLIWSSSSLLCAFVLDSVPPSDCSGPTS